MKTRALSLSLLLLTAVSAAARGRSGGGVRATGGAHISHSAVRMTAAPTRNANAAAPVFRPSARPAAAPQAANVGVQSHVAPVAAASRGGSHFAGRRFGAGISAPGDAPGGSGGSTPPPAAAPPWATPGSKILTAGQPPAYAAATGGGTASVNGGGFIAIDQSKAQDVARSPGVTWAKPDRTPSVGAGGISGSGAGSNGTAFDPSF